MLTAVVFSFPKQTQSLLFSYLSSEIKNSFVIKVNRFTENHLFCFEFEKIFTIFLLNCKIYAKITTIINYTLILKNAKRFHTNSHVRQAHQQGLLNISFRI